MTRFIKTRQDKKVHKKVNLSQKSPKNGTKDNCIYYNCKEKAIGGIVADLDLPKFNYCKKHKTEVSQAILWAIFGEIKLSNDALGFPKKKKPKS